MRFLALLLTLSCFAVSAQDTKSAARAAKAERLLALTNVNTDNDKLMDQMLNMVTSNFPLEVSPEVRDKLEAAQKQMFALIKERMSWERLKPEYVKLYTEVYTEKELDGMIHFYSSPVGRSMTAKSPMVMQRSMQMLQSLMAEMMPEIKRIAAEGAQR